MRLLPCPGCLQAQHLHQGLRLVGDACPVCLPLRRQLPVGTGRSAAGRTLRQGAHQIADRFGAGEHLFPQGQAAPFFQPRQQFHPGQAIETQITLQRAVQIKAQVFAARINFSGQLRGQPANGFGVRRQRFGGRRRPFRRQWMLAGYHLPVLFPPLFRQLPCHHASRYSLFVFTGASAPVIQPTRNSTLLLEPDRFRSSFGPFADPGCLRKMPFRHPDAAHLAPGPRSRIGPDCRPGYVKPLSHGPRVVAGFISSATLRSSGYIGLPGFFPWPFARQAVQPPAVACCFAWQWPRTAFCAGH